MESVAAERLNKLGKNPSIISTRQDLRIDQEALKDIVAKATPNPSDDSASETEKSEIDNATALNASTIIRNKDSNLQALKKKSKLLTASMNLHLPSLLLKKSPSSPSKLFRKISTDPNV